MAQDMQGFLGSHPKINRKYNRLGPQEQATFQQRYQDNGPRQAKRYARGILNNTPRPMAGGPQMTKNQFNLQDPRDIINMQQWQNAQNQYMNFAGNRVDQNSAFGGGVNYNYDPQSGQWTQNQTMGQPMQDLYNQTGKALQFGNDAATPWSQDYSQIQNRAENAVYDRFAKRMEPQFAQENENLQQQLADQGIQFSDDPNSMYQRQLKSLQQRQDDLRQDTQNQAILTGQQYGQNQFNQALAGRQAYTGEQAQQWQSPYSGLAALTGAQGQFQQSFSPMYTNSVQQMNYMQPAQQFYEWNVQDPRRQGWAMAQIGAQGANQVNAINANAVANAEANMPPPD